MYIYLGSDPYDGNPCHFDMLGDLSDNWKLYQYIYLKNGYWEVVMGCSVIPKSDSNLTVSPHFGVQKHEESSQIGISQFWLYCEVLSTNNFQ